MNLHYVELMARWACHINIAQFNSWWLEYVGYNIVSMVRHLRHINLEGKNLKLFICMNLMCHKCITFLWLMYSQLWCLMMYDWVFDVSNNWLINGLINLNNWHVTWEELLKLNNSGFRYVNMWQIDGIAYARIWRIKCYRIWMYGELTVSLYARMWQNDNIVITQRFNSLTALLKQIWWN